jgi:hypothetical protein
MKMEFCYKLTDTFRRSEFIRTGDRPDWIIWLEIDSKQTTEEMRARFDAVSGKSGRPVDLDGEYDRVLGESDLLPILNQMAEESRQKQAEAKAELDDLIPVLLSKDLSVWASPTVQDAERLCEKAGLPDQYLRQVLVKEAADKMKAKADRAAKEEAEELRIKAAKAEKAANKSSWIEDHGSDHLKRAHKADFDCHRKYIQERADLEYPGFNVDWKDNARWESIACPSVESLDFLDLHPDAEAVWLKYGIDSGDVQCEALVVRGYLGSKYDLVRAV